MATKNGNMVIMNCHVPHGKRLKEYVEQFRMEYVKAAGRGAINLVGDFNYDPSRAGMETEVDREMRELCRGYGTAVQQGTRAVPLPITRGSAESRIDALYVDPELV